MFELVAGVLERVEAGPGGEDDDSPPADRKREGATRRRHDAGRNADGLVAGLQAHDNLLRVEVFSCPVAILPPLAPVGAESKPLGREVLLVGIGVVLDPPRLVAGAARLALPARGLEQEALRIALAGEHLADVHTRSRRFGWKTLASTGR
jgi:hypothetical protein